MSAVQKSGPVELSQGELTILETPVRPGRLALVGRLNPNRAIYPYRMLNDLEFGAMRPRALRAITLENEFLKLTVLPELGGKLHRAVYKPAGYDLFYHNDAIRAQLVSSRGAWYAGGVEFNFPVSHSLTTHAGVEWQTQRSGDGSAAVLVGNTDRCSHMRWQVAIRLVPGSTAIHFQTRLLNRTAWPHRYYYWLNAAVPQGPQIRYHFSASRLIGHLQEVDGTRTRLDTFPILRNGSDAREPASLADTTSIFMLDNHSGFFGYYDLEANLGLVRSAPVRNVPGNKIWSWGDTDYGRRFNRRLVPPGAQFYGELQSGRPESQTDWAIIEPFELIEADECWYPIPALGGMTDGGAELTIHCDPPAGRVRLAANRPFEGLTVRVEPAAEAAAAGGAAGPGSPLAEQTFQRVRPGEPVQVQFAATGQPIRVRVTDAAGREVFQYCDPAAGPESVICELYENKADESSGGRTAEQLTVQAVAAYRANDLLDAEQFCLAALAREPRFAPANRWLGFLLRMRGDFAGAVEHFKAALLADPMDYDAFYLYAAGLLDLADGEPAATKFERAAMELERVIGYAHGQQRAWAAVLLARCLLGLGRRDQARRLTDEWPAQVAFGPLGRLGPDLGLTPDPRSRWWNDPMDLFEQAVKAARPADALDAWWSRNVKAHDDAADAVLEVAHELLDAADRPRAVAVLTWLAAHPTLGAACPLAHYLLGSLNEDLPAAVARAAKVTDRERMAWPARLTDQPLLIAACTAAPDDALARGLLGLFQLWLGRYDEAARALELATQLDPSDAAAWRNLGLARWSAAKPWQDCAAAYEHALALWPDYWPLVVEFDCMLAERSAPADRRHRLLYEGLHAALASDAMIATRRAELALASGDYQAGLAELADRQFHPGEGGFGVQRLFMHLNLLAGERLAGRGDWSAALPLFRRALEYPDNIGIGRPGRAHESRERYLLAMALEKLGDPPGAQAELGRLASMCLRNSPAEAYFGILALRKLGREPQADQWLEDLARAAETRAAGPTDGARHWARVTEAMLARARGQRDESNRLLADWHPAPPSELADYLRSKLY